MAASWMLSHLVPFLFHLEWVLVEGGDGRVRRMGDRADGQSLSESVRMRSCRGDASLTAWGRQTIVWLPGCGLVRPLPWKGKNWRLLATKWWEYGDGIWIQLERTEGTNGATCHRRGQRTGGPKTRMMGWQLPARIGNGVQRRKRVWFYSLEAWQALAWGLGSLSCIKVELFEEDWRNEDGSPQGPAGDFRSFLPFRCKSGDVPKWSSFLFIKQFWCF